MYYPRIIENAVIEAIDQFPVTAIIGTRQCGKSTLVKHLNYSAIEDISPDYTFVVTPSPNSWSMNKGIDVVSLETLLQLANILAIMMFFIFY